MLKQPSNLSRIRLMQALWQSDTQL